MPDLHSWGPAGLAGPAALWLCLAAAGCKAPVLSVDDAVVLPGQKTRLVACVEREPVLGLSKDVENVRVRFDVEGQAAGDAKTNQDGAAEVERRLNPGVQRYEAWALVDGQELYAQGRVFTWEKQRVIIAVDVDHTIARTDYEDLLRDDREDESDPVKRSAKTLAALAQDFHIVYLTGRPRFLLDKTRAWLREEEFPPGPVVTSNRVRDLMSPGQFKEQKLHALRKAWPMLLIGIGDRRSDADAYGANGMLSLMLASKAEHDFGPHALVFRDWKALGQFFAANREVLTDPPKLREALSGRTMLLQTLERYQGR